MTRRGFFGRLAAVAGLLGLARAKGEPKTIYRFEPTTIEPPPHMIASGSPLWKTCKPSYWTKRPPGFMLTRREVTNGRVEYVHTAGRKTRLDSRGEIVIDVWIADHLGNREALTFREMPAPSPWLGAGEGRA